MLLLLVLSCLLATLAFAESEGKDNDVKRIFDCGKPCKTSNHHADCPDCQLCFLQYCNIDNKTVKGQFCTLGFCGGDNFGGINFGPVRSASDLPYQVRLAKRGCGGSIITPSWVLTAKHCVVKDMNIEDYTLTLANGSETILAGISNLQDPNGQKRDISVDAVFIHDSADLALIRIDPPFELNDNVKPIQINHIREELVTRNGERFGALMSGWGETGSEAEPDQLKIAAATIMEKKDAGKWGNVLRLLSSRGKGACSGDGGGPAVIDESNQGRTVLVGVASYVDQRCGVSDGVSEEENNEPRNSYYVNVFRYVDWIDKTIGVA